MTDTTRTLEIEGSPVKLLGLVAAGVVMIAASVAVVMRPEMPTSLEEKVVGYFGVAFFSLCTVVVIWRLFTTRGPVLTISPQGIQDTRVAAKIIPWTAIKSISTFEVYKQKAMMLAVDEGTRAQLGLAPMAHWAHAANELIGAEGVPITAAGLKIDYPTLLQTSLDYAKAAQQKAPSSPPRSDRQA